MDVNFGGNFVINTAKLIFFIISFSCGDTFERYFLSVNGIRFVLKSTISGISYVCLCHIFKYLLEFGRDGKNKEEGGRDGRR
jgi:hypothetical protein